MKCNICNSPSESLFTKKILQKYDSHFYRCTTCGFMQTDQPHWLAEAYEDAISNMDTGIFIRNGKFQKIVPFIIKAHFNKNGKFLDYGAGYGIFVRMMRDKGFDFWWQDDFCQNLFAKNYAIDSLAKEDQKFELLTAFEVFEHLPDPISEVKKMLTYTDSILFSTTLVPDTKDLTNWWYLSHETGQHVSFFTEKSLRILGEKYGLHFYTNGYNFHLLTKKKINPIIFNGLKATKFVLDKIKRSESGAQLDRENYK